MKIREITEAIERFAPLALQESYDNAGLIIGNPETEAAGAVICLDATEQVLDEAVEKGANLVVAHHPIVFHPLRAVTGQTNVERVVIRAIRNDIAIYAAHTNLDRAAGGMSHALAEKLGLQKIEILAPEENGNGFGAVGELPKPMEATEFLRSVKNTLALGCIRHSAPPKKSVRRIALIAGAGGEGLEKAIAAKADIFLTADLKYDRFFAAEKRIGIADIGHFESEIVAIDLLCEVLAKKFPTFALHKSKKQHNPVNYL